MSYGMLGYIGVAKETTWGTPVTAGSFMEAMSENLSTALDRFDTRNIFNSLSEPDDAVGLQRNEGDIVIPANPEALGLLLSAGLGLVASTSVTATYWNHVFQTRINDVSSLNPLPAYTYEVFRDVTSAQQYAGGQVRQLVLASQPNQDLRVTATLLAKSVLNKARIAAASVLFPTTPGQPFTFDTCSIAIAGAATDRIEGFTLTINNQLEGVPALNNSTTLARVHRTGPVMINLQGTISFNDVSEFLDFMNQTERAFSISFSKANSFLCVMNLQRCVYQAFPLGQQGRGRNTVSFDAKARVPVGSASAIAVQLRNNTSAY